MISWRWHYLEARPNNTPFRWNQTRSLKLRVWLALILHCFPNDEKKRREGQTPGTHWLADNKIWGIPRQYRLLFPLSVESPLYGLYLSIFKLNVCSGNLQIIQLAKVDINSQCASTKNQTVKCKDPTAFFWRLSIAVSRHRHCHYLLQHCVTAIAHIRNALCC